MTPISFARFRFGLEGFESNTVNMPQQSVTKVGLELLGQLKIILSYIMDNPLQRDPSCFFHDFKVATLSEDLASILVLYSIWLIGTKLAGVRIRRLASCIQILDYSGRVLEKGCIL